MREESSNRDATGAWEGHPGASGDSIAADGVPASARQTASAAEALIRVSAVVFGLSLLALAHIAWTVLSASAGPSFSSVFHRTAIDIVVMGLGAMLTTASGILMFRLRSDLANSHEQVVPDDAAVHPPSDIASKPVAGQTPLATSPSISTDEPADSLCGTSAKARVAYGEVGLEIAMIFGAALGRTALDLEGLLNRTVELLAERCPWDESPAAEGVRAQVAIFLVDEQGEWATLQAASSVSGKALVLRGHRLRRGKHTGVGCVMTERRVWQGADGAGASLPAPELTPLHSAIALPIVPDTGSSETGIDAGAILGVLDIRSVRQDGYTQEDVDGLTRISSYLGTVISSVRRLENALGARGAPSPFYKIANRLAAVPSEADAYIVMLSALRDFDPKRIVIVRTPSKNAHSDPGAPGDPDALHVVADIAQAEFPGLNFPQSRSRLVSMKPIDLADMRPPSLVDIIIMGLALDHPLWVEDLGSYATAPSSRVAGGGELDAGMSHPASPELANALRELAERYDLGGLAFVPLRIADGSAAGFSVGGILVLYGEAHMVTPLERSLYEMLADLGGVVLERNRLFAEASKQLEREQCLTAIRERLRATLDPDEIMRTTAQELGRALGAQLTTVALSLTPGPAAAAVPNDDLAAAHEGH